MNTPATFNLKDRIVCLILVISIFSIYRQALYYDFIVVDDAQFLANPFIQKGLSIEGIKWMFSSFYTGYWIPLNWFSHMLDFQLYGDHAFGHHFTNLAFHTGNAILLFLFFRMATGYIWRSAAVAALFAVHPLNVESVVWITERKDVLSTFWGLLTLVCYLRYTQRLRISWYIAAVCSFALSLMSKPMLVTLPFVMLLLDYWPLGRVENTTRRYTGLKANSLFHFFVYLSDWKRILYEKIPFFLFSIFFAVLTYVGQSQNGVITSSEIFPVKVRIFNAFVSYNLYVFKMFWPENLAIFYPHPGEAISILEFAGACFVIIILCILSVWYIKLRPYVFIGWSWFLITLIPVIGIIQPFYQAMADRFTYVPIIGILTVIVWLTADITKSLRLSKITILLLFGTVMAFFMIKTCEQTSHWHDSRTLLRHAINATKDNYFAHLLLANYGSLAGNKNKAGFHFDKAAAANPRYVAMRCNNAGTFLVDKEELDNAIIEFKKALDICPDFQSALYNCGVVLARKGQFDEAIKMLSRLIEIDPDHSKAIGIRSLCIEEINNRDGKPLDRT